MLHNLNMRTAARKNIVFFRKGSIKLNTWVEQDKSKVGCYWLLFW